MNTISGIRFGITDSGVYGFDSPRKATRPKKRGSAVIAAKYNWLGNSKKLQSAKRQLPSNVSMQFTDIAPSSSNRITRTQVSLMNKEKGLIAQQTFPQWSGIHAAAHWIRVQAKKLQKTQ